ncbi:hypothetical protein O6H91_23G024300 [Diphasiastrum complanatum]|nr:hypothetical protein O6H91_23G024300 [Diphasiastrum complanatum]
MCSESQHIGPSSELKSIKEHNYGKNSKVQTAVHLTSKLVRVFVKFVGTLFLVAIVAVVGTPTFLSTEAGLAAAISLANQAITGKLSIEKASLGWTKPVQLQGISLKNIDEESVLSIPELKTKAFLWAIIMGKSDFGDCTITSPCIDLKKDQHTGLSRLALAVVPPHKLSRLKRQPVRPIKRVKRVEPAKNVTLVAKVKAPNGNLEVLDGHLSFPGDAAAVLGNRLVLDVLIDKWAMDDNEALRQLADPKSELSPVQATLWSDNTHAEMTGFINRKTKRIELIKPIKMEMDLTPAVGQLYLSRINPLLGDIMGPVVKDEDMPDVILQIFPHDMVLPAQQHKIRIEPMEMVVARGPIVDGVLSLLSKGDIIKGNREIKLRTSTIEVDLEVDDCLKCSRIDLLIADKVHLATWGRVDLVDETIQMMLGIPNTTLKDLLGFAKLPLDYYLQIPIKGTLDQPQVDFIHAGFNIAQLALYQRAGPYMEHIVEQLSLSEERPPKPISSLPWATSRDKA